MFQTDSVQIVPADSVQIVSTGSVQMVPTDSVQIVPTDSVQIVFQTDKCSSKGRRLFNFSTQARTLGLSCNLDV